MRAALARLEILDCTLDPAIASAVKVHAVARRLSLTNGYGFADPIEGRFSTDPRIRSNVRSRLRLDDGYALVIGTHCRWRRRPDLEQAKRNPRSPARPIQRRLSAPLTLHNMTFFGQVRDDRPRP